MGEARPTDTVNSKTYSDLFLKPAIIPTPFPPAAIPHGCRMVCQVVLAHLGQNCATGASDVISAVDQQLNLDTREGQL